MSKNERHVEKVCEVVHSYRRLTVQEVPDEAGILKKSCWEILNENLGMRHIAAKPVPRLLSEEQKQSALKSVKNILSVQTMMQIYVKKVIIGKEKWVYEYDVKTKKITLNNGSQKPLSEPKSHVKFSKMWMWCWLLY